MTKYRAKPCTIDGIRFASQGEGRRYAELKLLERAGVIQGLRLQPRYVIQDSFRREGKVVQAISYVADFEYTENSKRVAEDFKGVETAVFRLKRKMFWKRYPGIELRVTK
jgi:hypothetical protein